MKNTETISDTSAIENKFIFNQAIQNLHKVSDDEGYELSFHRHNNGSNVIFTKDLEGIDVAIEHCVDGSKVFHLTQDSKGLPAMHEFRPDGTEVMYLLDKNKKLEKMIDNKYNGDKVTTWFYPHEVIVQEQRQKGGIVFRLTRKEGEALIWLKTDGSLEKSGDENLLRRLKQIFTMYLDGTNI